MGGLLCCKAVLARLSRQWRDHTANGQPPGNCWERACRDGTAKTQLYGLRRHQDVAQRAPPSWSRRGAARAQATHVHYE